MAEYQSIYTGAEHDAYVTKASLVNLMFPVGSVYITMGNTNPGTFLGGTWEQFSLGRVLIGVGTGTDTNNTSKTFSANESYGVYSHTLTTAEIPPHKHKILLFNNGIDNGVTHTYHYRVARFDEGNSEPSSYWSGQDTIRAYEGDCTGGPHTNIQPYTTVYFWKRIA